MSATLTIVDSEAMLLTNVEDIIPSSDEATLTKVDQDEEQGKTNTSTSTNTNTNTNTEEVGTKKRGRGRPPGSKNKPKTPTYNTSNLPHQYLLEVAPASDIVSSLSQYARSRGTGVVVSVQQASGSVSHGCLRGYQFSGKFDIISLSGIFFFSENNNEIISGLTASVCSPTGQVIGGKVYGQLVAEGPVFVLVATFPAANFEKLPEVPSGSGFNNVSMGMLNRLGC